jgi:hypothetical protein
MLVVAGCTAPEYGSGHLQCASSGRICPDDFYCAGDHHCWKNGSAPDLSANPSDLAGEDLAVAADLSHADLASHDLAGNPSLCGGLAVKLCDGFEGPLNARWSNDINNGAITIDTSRAYRGGSSLHLHTNPEPSPATEPQANVRGSAGLPISTTIYLRAWVYFPAGTPAVFDQLLNFSNPGMTGISYVSENGHPELNDYGSGGPFNSSSLFTVANDRWTCLQMEIPQPAGAMGVIRLFLDGNEVTDVTTTSSAATPAMDHYYLGLDWYNNPANLPATDMWLDEVILDDQPTTCAE